MRIARPSLWTTSVALAALVIVACYQPADEHEPSASPKLEIPPTTLASTANEAIAMSIAADDAAITARVKAAVFAEPALKSLNIHVDTKDAIVTLSGSVDSTDLRERAKQIATSMVGVHGVVDNLMPRATS